MKNVWSNFWWKKTSTKKMEIEILSWIHDDCHLLWFNMISYDLPWFNMISYDLPWFHMIYHDLIWFHMIYHDFIWFTMIYHYWWHALTSSSHMTSLWPQRPHGDLDLRWSFHRPFDPQTHQLRLVGFIPWENVFFLVLKRWLLGISEPSTVQVGCKSRK